MQALLSRTFVFYKRYKATILAYLLFWWFSLSTQLRYKAAIDHINAGEKLAWGEGVMYWYFLTFAVSVGSTIIMLLNVALNKEARMFYFVMSILTITPLMIYLSIYGYKIKKTLLLSLANTAFEYTSDFCIVIIPRKMMTMFCQ